VVKAFGGTTEAEKQALIFLIGGAVALILGLGVFFRGRR
jgi:LPXTG-motif cell wall-anchored protein